MRKVTEVPHSFSAGSIAVAGVSRHARWARRNVVRQRVRGRGSARERRASRG
jgi:hypothetical protein